MRSIASFLEPLDHYGVPIRTGDYTKEFPNTSEAKCFLIRMIVVDSQNCFGPQVNVTVPVADSNPPQAGVSGIRLMDYLLSHRKEIFPNKLFRALRNNICLLMAKFVFTQITYQLILICVAVSIVTLAAFMLIAYVLLWKNRKKNIVNYWRGLYHSVQHG